MGIMGIIGQWSQIRRDRKAKSLPGGSIDIVDLYKKGLLSAHGTGQSITDITAEIISRVSIPLKVAVPHGTYFVSRGNHQNMVTRRKYEFELEPFVTKCIRVPASCINASLPIPGEQDHFSGVARVPANVQRFMSAAEGEDAMVIQAGVWALTDGYSRQKIQATLRSRRVSHYEVSAGVSADEGPAISDRQIDRAKEILDRLGIQNGLTSVAERLTSPGVVGVQIESFGIYRAEIREVSQNQNMVSRYSNESNHASLIEQTDRIPLRKGLTFGVSIIPTGQAKIPPVRLRYIWRFPPPGLKNPETGKTHLRDEAPCELAPGQAVSIIYRFDEEFEMLRGQWVFELWDGEKKLAERIFRMEPPSRTVRKLKDKSRSRRTVNSWKRLLGVKEAPVPRNVTGQSTQMPITSDPNTSSVDPRTPSIYDEIRAAAGGMDQLNTLLRRDPGLASSIDQDGWTPLHEAALHGDTGVAKALLSYKADVNATDNQGRTPLHVAVTNRWFSNKPMVQLLLANHARVDVQDSNGKTPSQQAAEMGYTDLAELLAVNTPKADQGGI